MIVEVKLVNEVNEFILSKSINFKYQVLTTNEDYLITYDNHMITMKTNNTLKDTLEYLNTLYLNIDYTRGFLRDTVIYTLKDFQKDESNLEIEDIKILYSKEDIDRLNEIEIDTKDITLTEYNHYIDSFDKSNIALIRLPYSDQYIMRYIYSMNKKDDTHLILEVKRDATEDVITDLMEIMDKEKKIKVEIKTEDKTITLKNPILNELIDNENESYQLGIYFLK